MKVERPRLPLRLKLGLMAVTVTVVPLFVVGLALIDINSRAIKDRIREFQVAVADDIARSLRSQLEQTRETLVTLQRVFADPRVTDPVAVAEALIEASESVDHVLVFDVQGRLIDTVRQASAPDTLSGEVPEGARKQLENAAWVVGEPTFQLGTRVPVFLPLRVGGTLTGYLGSDTPLAAVQARVSRLGAAHFGEASSPVLVVDAQGRLLAGASTPMPPGTVIK